MTASPTVAEELLAHDDQSWPLARVRPPEPDRHRAVVEAFAEITNEAATSATLRELLRLVGRKLCAVLEVTRCSAFLRRSDGRFQGVVGHAADGDITTAVRQLIAGTSEDELTGEAVARRGAVLVADAQRDERPVRRAMRRWRVHALLAVPLVFDREVIGMLYVDDETGGHTYTDGDIEVAELFGRLAALVLRQAQVSTGLTRQVRQLARQRDALEQLGDLRSRLTRAALEGADIDAVVALLSELAGKPVVLFDSGRRVRAWAAPPVLRLTRPPVLPEGIRGIPSVAETMAELDLDNPSTTIPARRALGVSRRHLLHVLVAEGRRAGYLDIVEMGGPLRPLDSELAEHGATVLSLLLLAEQRQAQADDQARDDFLADLLCGVRDSEQLARRAPRFGVDVNRAHVLVRFPTHDHAPALPPSELRALLVGAAARRLKCGEPASVSLRDAVILLVELPGVASAAAIRRLHRGLDDMLAEVREQAGVRRAVVSGVCRQITDFPTANREIRELDELLDSFGGREGVIGAESLGVLRLVASRGGIDEAVRFAEQRLGPLRGATDLEATLRAYLRAGAQVRATAESLGVHENTVRYRLSRITRLTGSDLRSFDALLIAQLAFQVLDLTGGWERAE